MSATDQQMQTYADGRMRKRAEGFRAIVDSARDDKASIEAVFDRAANGAAWNDARTDGPPKLLTQQSFLVYNSVITLFLKCIDGTATLQDLSDLHGNWPQFQELCVRPVGEN